jgi:hypothetical protein
MELIIIAVVILVAVWYGLFKPVETVAHAIDDEVQVLAAERKAENIGRLSEIKVTDEQVKAAQSNLSRLSSIKL